VKFSEVEILKSVRLMTPLGRLSHSRLGGGGAHAYDVSAPGYPSLAGTQQANSIISLGKKTEILEVRI
jgi:hypothetical protein